MKNIQDMIEKAAAAAVIEAVSGLRARILKQFGHKDAPGAMQSYADELERMMLSQVTLALSSAMLADESINALRDEATGISRFGDCLNPPGIVGQATVATFPVTWEG